MSRHYLHGFGLNEIREIQLHGFSDTSVKLLAAVIYLRFILIDGSMFTSLVPSKTKVILIKKAKIIRSTLGIISLFAAYEVIEKYFVFVKFSLFRYQVVLLD